MCIIPVASEEDVEVQWIQDIIEIQPEAESSVTKNIGIANVYSTIGLRGGKNGGRIDFYMPRILQKPILITSTILDTNHWISELYKKISDHKQREIIIDLTSKQMKVDFYGPNESRKPPTKTFEILNDDILKTDFFPDDDLIIKAALHKYLPYSIYTIKNVPPYSTVIRFSYSIDGNCQEGDGLIDFPIRGPFYAAKNIESDLSNYPDADVKNKLRERIDFHTLLKYVQRPPNDFYIFIRKHEVQMDVEVNGKKLHAMAPSSYLTTVGAERHYPEASFSPRIGLNVPISNPGDTELPVYIFTPTEDHEGNYIFHIEIRQTKCRLHEDLYKLHVK